MKVSYTPFVWLAVLVVSCRVSTSGAFAPSRNVPQQRSRVVYMSEPNGAAAPQPTSESAPATAAAAAAPPAPMRANPREDVAEASNQKEYGVSLPMPDTYVRCGRCQTTFALKVEDLGSRGNGARIACCVCDHSWYQSRDRLFDVRDGFEFIKLPETEKERIAKNIEAGRSPDYVGEYKLYVGNLDFRCTETDLRDVFSKAGDIGEVNIVTDNETGRSRGFAFVTMINEADGIKAKEAYDGTELLGRQLSIREPNN